MDTDRLVERARTGDQAAFASLAAAHTRRLHAVAYGILRDRHAAEDAVQHALIEIWRDLPRLREPERFEAWSYRLLVRACYRELRAVRRWLPSLLDRRAVEGASAGGITSVADRDQLERGFRLLSVDHRAVVVLHHYQDLPLEEVALILGIPAGTARSRLHRAMAALRAALDADERLPAASDAKVIGR